MNKKRILFVLKEFCNPEAQNAICVRGIMEALKDEFEIDVLSYERSKYNVPSPGVTTFTLKENRFLKNVKKAFTFPIEKKLLHHFEKELKCILSNKQYDIIIAVENPIEAIVSVSRIKMNYSYKFIIYEIDPASNRFKRPKTFFERLWFRRSTIIEKKCYSNADFILHMKSHQNHFLSLYGNNFLEKSDYVDIPSIHQRYYVNSYNHSSNTFLYCGAFYKKMREPYKPLAIMLEVLADVGGSFNIFTSGFYLRWIKNNYGTSPHIYVHDYIPNEQIISEYSKSNFLISVGNSESDFLPSKTIQYISTGKPIIHFYYDKNDSSLSYLRRYKNALLVDLNEDERFNKQKIVEYIKNRHLFLSFKDIYREFYCNTFDFTANKIKEIIYGFDK